MQTEHPRVWDDLTDLDGNLVPVPGLTTRDEATGLIVPLPGVHILPVTPQDMSQVDPDVVNSLTKEVRLSADDGTLHYVVHPVTGQVVQSAGNVLVTPHPDRGLSNIFFTAVGHAYPSEDGEVVDVHEAAYTEDGHEVPPVMIARPVAGEVHPQLRGAVVAPYFHDDVLALPFVGIPTSVYSLNAAGRPIEPLEPAEILFSPAKDVRGRFPARPWCFDGGS